MKITIEFKTAGIPQSTTVIRDMQDVPRIGELIYKDDDDSSIGQVTTVIWLRNGKALVKVLV